MDRAFIALLFLVASSGLALMVLKGTPALAVTLCIHLGAVMALFATMPSASLRTVCTALQRC